MFDLYWFIDNKSNNPVFEFIQSLPKQERTKIAAYAEELQRHGHNLRRPMADYLGQGIYELRPKDNRIFYFFYLREKVVFIHAIRKKTDKIPQSDFEICLKRKSIVEESDKNITAYKGVDL